jgi:predicted HAD superfamily Cof-like phosphohydrolase
MHIAGQDREFDPPPVLETPLIREHRPHVARRRMDALVDRVPAPAGSTQMLPLDLSSATCSELPVRRRLSTVTSRPGEGGRSAKRQSAEDCSYALFAVSEFHRAFGLPVATMPTTSIPADLRQLRVDLLVEEVREFADATEAKDIVGIADALADILYVTYGAAITYGVDLDQVVREVHRSNMGKLDEMGRPVLREDGKVLKSARYTRPDVVAVLEAQLPLPI